MIVCSEFLKSTSLLASWLAISLGVWDPQDDGSYLDILEGWRCSSRRGKNSGHGDKQHFTSLIGT
jgi:hypothetical protein